MESNPETGVQDEMRPPLVRKAELAKMLSISERQIDYLKANHAIPYIASR